MSVISREVTDPVQLFSRLPAYRVLTV